MTLKLKVIARSQPTHTTCLVCPEDIDMCIFNCENKGGHSCFVLEEFNTVVTLFFSACFRGGFRGGLRGRRLKNAKKVNGSRRVPYLLVYKSTFHDQKISPKNRPRLIHESYTKT